MGTLACLSAARELNLRMMADNDTLCFLCPVYVVVLFLVAATAETPLHKDRMLEMQGFPVLFVAISGYLNLIQNIERFEV